MVHCPWPRGGATPDWWDTDPIEVEGRRVIEHGLPTWKVTCAGRAVQWHRLPIHIRWPLLYQGLGWTPSPLQPTAPVRTLLARVGVH